MEGQLYESIRLIMAAPLDQLPDETRITERTRLVAFTTPTEVQDSKVTNKYRI